MISSSNPNKGAFRSVHIFHLNCVWPSWNEVMQFLEFELNWFWAMKFLSGQLDQNLKSMFLDLCWVFFRSKLFISYKIYPLSYDWDKNKLKMLRLMYCLWFLHLHLSNFQNLFYHAVVKFLYSHYAVEYTYILPST